MDDDSDISFEDLDEGTPPKRPGVQTPPVPKGRPKRSVGQRETRSTRPTGSSRPTTEYHDLEGTAYQRKGPATWQDVDQQQLGMTAMRLITNIASTAPTDDKSREAIWHPTTTLTVSAELVDPLGMGKIDPDKLCLEKTTAGTRNELVVQRLSMGQTLPTSTAKGAVGRFISELTRQQHASVVARLPAGAHGAESGVGSSGNAAASAPRRSKSLAPRGLDLPLNQVLPSADGFDPDAYLAVFHDTTTLPELQAGMRTLDKELSERTGQLKQLVKQNFERFISCKTTIDDIYVKLQRIESQSTGISTEILYNAIQEVQGSAKKAFGPILERHTKAERIKSVMALLKRFNALFSMPARIRALAAARDYEQVSGEYKKANALIRPSAGTAKVWVSLHGEIEKRVGEVYRQLQGEVQDPLLPATAYPDLMLHMLALQAEGLPVAKGDNAVGLFLAARQQYFNACMASATAEHERSLQLLQQRYSSSAEATAASQDPSKILDQNLLTWTADPELDDISSQLPTAGLHAAACQGGAVSSAAASATAGQGFEPAVHKSVVVTNTQPTSGQYLYVKCIGQLCSVLLECLPTFWHAAGSSRLHNPPDMPAGMRDMLTQGLVNATAIAEQLVQDYCKKVLQAVAVVAAMGPMQTAMLMIVQSLAHTTHQLIHQKAPDSAISSCTAVLHAAVDQAVQSLCNHLTTLPAKLVVMETWALNLTHTGNEPITHLPELLQEEVTAAMHYYQSLLMHCSVVGDVPADVSSTPLQKAYFQCFEQYTKCAKAVAERLQPLSAAAAATTADEPAATTGRTRSQLLLDKDVASTSGRVASSAMLSSSRAGGHAANALSVLDDADDTLLGISTSRSGMSDDVKILVLTSNLGYIRNRLMASMTQRYLLLLTGEIESQVGSCSKAVKKLAGQMDKATQAMFSIYLDRKRRTLDRILSGYVRPDAGPLGVPPELKDITPNCQQLLHTVIVIQSEVYTYARDHMPDILPAALDHLAVQLNSRLSSLDCSVMAVESLIQYFMDLVWLDAVLTKAGPPSMRVELDTAYGVLASRIAASPVNRSSAVTPLARSVVTVKDAAELNKKLQVTCRQRVLPDILKRSSFTVRCLLRGA